VSADGICALFGLDHQAPRAARLALQAAGTIERATLGINNRLGHEGNRKLQIAVSIHVGRAVVGDVGTHDAPALMAVGEAMDVANELRKTTAAQGRAFAISEPVTTAAGVDPAAGDKITLHSHGVAIVAYLSASPPALPISRTRLAEQRAALQRLWSG
jgi:adenylate cyclase